MISNNPEAVAQRLAKAVTYIRQGYTLPLAAKRAHCHKANLSTRLKELGIQTKRQRQTNSNE